MATDDTAPAEMSTNAAAAAAPAETPAAPQPTTPAQMSPALAELPPRVDGGDDIEKILGDVSKVFGQAAGPAAAMGTLAGDEIDDRLNELAAIAPSPATAGPAGPPPEMPLSSAADLFRSAPDEIPTTTAPDAESTPTAEVAVQPEPNPTAEAATTVPAPTPRPEQPPASSHDSGDQAKGWLPVVKSAALNRAVGSVSRPAAAVRDWTKHGFARLPKGARLPVALALAMLMGWIAGSALNRTHAHQTSEEHLDAANSEIAAEAAAKAAEAEEAVKKADRERDAALRERQDAVARLKQFEIKAQKGQALAQAEIDRQQAARHKADENYRHAEHQLHLAQLRTYNAQLGRVRELWRSDPGQALALLEDVKRCPPELREFTWGYFYSRAKNDRGTLVAHQVAVNGMACSADGKLIATCGSEGLVKLHDAASGKELASFAAHAGGATAVAFSRRGDRMASCGADGTVKLWDVKSRKPIAVFTGHIGTVLAVAISPDGSALASTGEDGTVKFWDVASRRLTATRWGHPRSNEPTDAGDPTRFVRSVNFSPDGLLVASGGFRVVRIWNAGDATEKATLPVPDGDVTALAFSPQGTTLAVGSNGAIYRWKLSTMAPRSEPISLDGVVHDLKYSSDGRRLVAAVGTAALVFRELAEPVRDDLEHSVERSLVHDASGAEGGEGLRLVGHLGAVTGVAFSEDDASVVTCGVDGTLRFWDPQNGNVDKTQPDATLRELPPTVAVAYSPRGDVFAAAGGESITLWSARDNIKLATLRNGSGELTKIAFSPDGTRMASASKDWPVLIWDVPARQVKSALNGHTAAVNSVFYSADGKSLISAGDDGIVRMWDAIAAREIAALSGHSGPVRTACFSPDGKLAASAGNDRCVKLWDVAKKRESASLRGALGPIVALAFSPDGRFLVSAENSASATANTGTGENCGPIRMWSVPKGELLQCFGARGSSVDGITFSPDGKTLAACDGQNVSLWDPETGESRETLRFGDSGPVGSLAFSPNGLTLAAGGRSGIAFWTAAPFVAAARNHAPGK